MSNFKQMRRYYLPFSLLILPFLTLVAEPISSFSLLGFNDEKNPHFSSNFTLLGDAQIANGGIFVNLTSPFSGSGSGQILYNKPFKFLDSKSSKPISFSTDFTFSISSGDGDGLAFVIVPNGEISLIFDQGLFGISKNIAFIDRRFVAIEYDTHKDGKLGDLNGNHVGIDVGSFVSTVVSDVSNAELLLNSGHTLKSWIDYEASSKRLEVRLGESSSKKPYYPLISYPIDLSKMWGDREVLVGISSSRGNSRQMSSALFSWSFRITTARDSLHSMPLDPKAYLNEHQPVRRKKSCFLTFLGMVIFVTGCGTLIAFLALFLWVVFFSRHSNVAPELPLNSVEFRYEKVNVTVDNVSYRGMS